MLAYGPKEIAYDAVNIIERFVILLCDRTSACTKVDHAKRKLFPRKPSVQQIPPTRAALEEHAKRAVYQGGHIWGKKMFPDPVLPSPTDWGGGEDRRNQEWLQKPLQMQEGCTSVHRPLLL